jgi:DNA-directed RNA polymerase subunit RPC12/RpoP
MKKPPQTAKKLGQSRKSSKKKTPTKTASNDAYPRCTRCGSRTVTLEQLEQELLVTLSLHCLICGHHTFLGRPVIRLLRRPNVIIPDSIKRPVGE